MRGSASARFEVALVGAEIAFIHEFLELDATYMCKKKI